MKLIVDVPNDVYAKVMEYCEHNEIVEAVYGYIYRGIPLDEIRAEIEQLYMVDTIYEDVAVVDKADVLRIIDNYKGDKE